MKDKKVSMSGFLKEYAGDKFKFYYPSLIASALGGVVSVLPYYFIWRMIREVILYYPAINSRVIFGYLFWIVVSQVLAVVLSLAATAFSHYMAFSVETGIRSRSFSYILNLPIGYFQKNETGRIRKIIDDNASSTHSFIAHMLPDLAAVFTMPIILLGLMISVDIRFGLLCLAGLLFSFAMMATMMLGDGRSHMDSYMLALENMNTEGVEYIRGIPVVKVFNQSVESFKRFYQAIMDYDNFATSYVNNARTPMILNTLGLYLPIMLLGPLCIYLLRSSSEPLILITNCIFYFTIAILFNSTVMRIATLSEALNKFNHSMEKIYEIFKAKPLKKMDCPILNEKGIVFENVSFRYEENAPRVLKRINHKFEKNKSYAIVGASGSGKTTLINLIARFFDVDEGSIRIDGVDIRNYCEEELFKRISVVFQQDNLFKDSIFENIRMYDESKTKEDVMRAIKESSSQDILDNLEDGLDTIIGTRGTYVSGGEAQRLAIARCFLKDGDILLLDEATAYADPDNEHKILKALERLKESKTTLMIAHRLNLVVDFDEIIVLKDGVISDVGTHDELLKSSEYYKSLYDEYCRSVEWRISND